MNAINNLINQPRLGVILLRWTLAILMLFHGWAKVTGGVGGIEGMLAGKGLPGVLAYGVYIGEHRIRLETVDAISTCFSMQEQRSPDRTACNAFNGRLRPALFFSDTRAFDTHHLDLLRRFFVERGAILADFDQVGNTAGGVGHAALLGVMKGQRDRPAAQTRRRSVPEPGTGRPRRKALETGPAPAAGGWNRLRIRWSA